MPTFNGLWQFRVLYTDNEQEYQTFEFEMPSPDAFKATNFFRNHYPMATPLFITRTRDNRTWRITVTIPPPVVDLDNYAQDKE